MDMYVFNQIVFEFTLVGGNRALAVTDPITQHTASIPCCSETHAFSEDPK